MRTSPRVLVLRAPGTNCDAETATAFELAGGQPSLVHVNRLREEPRLLDQFQVLCIPGGFSYGDDVAAGRILACQIQHHLRQALEHFQQQDKLVLGICNGFQVLLKCGLLVSDSADGPAATLAWNDSGQFEDRWVKLRTAGGHCVLLEGLDRIFLPVAHAEGKFVARDPATLQRLRDQGHLVLRYCDEQGRDAVEFPANPNGSQASAAGLCDVSGRVLGIMPHPERYLFPTQHPYWTRHDRLGEHGDGLRLFANAIRYFQ
jgi:phosphoribosylformylglycinamidine synthase